MCADLFDQSAVSLSKSRREKKQKCTGLGNNSAETHEPINRGPRWTNMSITVKVQAWISGNHSNCVLILKPCSFLTNFSIAHVSLTCYELRFALYWGKITFAPPPPPQTAPALDCHLQHQGSFPSHYNPPEIHLPHSLTQRNTSHQIFTVLSFSHVQFETNIRPDSPRARRNSSTEVKVPVSVWK